MEMISARFHRRLFASLMTFFVLSTQSYAGDPDKGASVYHEHGCYSCHGYNGTGRTPLANNVSGILVNESVFVAFLRQRADRNPILPDNSMPSFGVSTLSGEQALDVYAYIKSMVDNPPEVDDIPTFVTILDAAKAAGNNDDSSN